MKKNKIRKSWSKIESLLREKVEMEEEGDSSKVGRGNNGVGGDQLEKQEWFRA